MQFTKIIGCGLLILGIIVICWTILHSYNIFTAKISPPLIFKIEEKTKDSLSGEEISPLNLEGIEDIIKEKIGDIFPFEFLPRLLNLVSWSIFAGILIFAGGQISIIGIQLIKR
jgi:hypothetical protein